MTTRDMTAREHIGTALTFLEQSAQEFAAGDILQGSEKLWGAAAHAIMAVAKQRGWATNSHRDLTNAAVRLAEERGDAFLRSGISVAGFFHRKFYGHGHFDPFYGSGQMDFDRSVVADYVHRLLAIADEAL